MEYIVVFSAGVLSAWLFLRTFREATQPAAASAPSRLQELGPSLAALGETSAHPRDLESNASFREAQTLLSSAEIPLNVLMDYASGANYMLASAALAALRERPDREEAVRPLTRRFQHLSAWPAFFALELFARVDERPAMGLLALQVREYWAEDPLVTSMFAEHFAARVARGDIPDFGDALASASATQLTTAEAFLRKLDHPAAQALLDAMTAWRRDALDRTYLQTVGRFIEDDPERRLVLEHEGIVEDLGRAEACIAREPYRSVLVVGEPRSGKTSFLTAVAMRAAARGWTVFEAGALDVTAGQLYIGQLEERVQRLTSELAADKRVVWHVPDFLLLASSGRHEYQTASILDQVLPAITAGKLVILSETTPAGYTTLVQNRPALRGALELVRLRPASDAESDRLSRMFATRLTEVTQLEIEPDVLETATHLARHYLGGSQMPAAAIDLLKRTAQRVTAHGRTRMERHDVLDILSQVTGMPPLVLDTRERLDLATVRRFFTARVIGQDEAIDAVVDRIAMLKAGLIDPGKPIAVFLFAGPTGTGKTELAKTVAEFLFGSADRMIRLDMSEFQTAESTKKIVGATHHHSDVQSLAHQVSKQPFSVLLLDEFEKAHPDTWDLFLQVFDDGRLTDALGRTADFRHCIIILTSNLGARIPPGLGVGFGSTAAAFSQAQVLKTVHDTFRPEFVNRLDAVLVFRPLSRELMRGILMKELALVLDRRGLRDREWAVEWETSALDFLLDKGFSSTMGARPLKRAIDRHVLAPLAATLVEHRFPEGDQFLFVRSDGRAIQVEFVDPDAPEEPLPPSDVEAVDARLTLPRMILQPAGTADEEAALAAELSRISSRLTDDRWIAIEAAISADMQQPGFWQRPDRFRILARYALVDRVRAAPETARGLETRLRRSSVRGRFSKDLVTRLASQLHAIEHGIEDVLTGAPVEVVVVVQPVRDASDDPDASVNWCDRVLQMYRRWATRRLMHIDEVPGSGSRSTLIVVSGFGAARVLSQEVGLHVLDYSGPHDQSARAAARVRLAATPDVVPEEDGPRYAALMAALEGTAPSPAVVRRYRLEGSPLVRDVARNWRTGRADWVMDGQFDLLADVLPQD